MSFPPYSEYKDSGAEWLGEVPSHWEMRRLKLVCQAFPSNVDKKSYDGQDVVRLCNYVDVYYNDEITADLPFMEATASKEEIAKFTLFPGDTIITKDSETADDIAIAAYVPRELSGVVCGYHLTIVRPLGDMCGRFVKRLFDSHFLKAQFEVAANGLTRVGLSQYAINNALLPVPPVPEQSAIAAFLDRETAKIDELVAEQEKLIELLKEKRQAVISHAVTKGLDPSVPMTDSGIEWLGEVPAHWAISRVKHLCSHVVDCLHTTPTYDGDLEYPAIRTADVDRGVLLLDQARLVCREIYEERIQRLRPVAGDILYSREGERFGMAALVPEGVDVCLGQRMMMFRVNDRAIPAFTMWLLNSDAVYKQVLEKVGGSTSPHVNISDIINFHVPLPPPDEQSKIADHVAKTTVSVDALTAEALRAIELLKEHRSALISAAVTGKIDVRSLVSSQEAA